MPVRSNPLLANAKSILRLGTRHLLSSHNRMASSRRHLETSIALVRRGQVSVRPVPRRASQRFA